MISRGNGRRMVVRISGAFGRWMAHEFPRLAISLSAFAYAAPRQYGNDPRLRLTLGKSNWVNGDVCGTHGGAAEQIAQLLLFDWRVEARRRAAWCVLRRAFGPCCCCCCCCGDCLGRPGTRRAADEVRAQASRQRHPDKIVVHLLPLVKKTPPRRLRFGVAAKRA